MEKKTEKFDQEIIALCQKLIRIPSVNGKNDELEIAQFIAGFARDHGLESEITALEPNRPNVLVRLGPNTTPGLVLVGHMDTVPTGKLENWQHAPFSGTIAGNKLFGRGAIDNKGGIAAALGALLLLKEKVFGELNKQVVLVCVPDEESGATGRLGIKHLHSLNKLAGTGAIYTYPYLSETAIGHRGVLRLRFITRGKSFHTGIYDWQKASKNYNAVTGLSEILLNLEKIQFKQSKEYPLFERFKTIITPTMIQGGSGLSIVPAYSEAHVDIRLVPSTSRELVLNQIQEIIAEVQKKRPELEIEIQETNYLPPTQIPTDEKIVKMIVSTVNEVIGQAPRVVVSGPANESYLLNEIGIPTCTLGPEGKGAHAANEFVFIDSLTKTVEIYAKIALQM